VIRMATMTFKDVYALLRRNGWSAADAVIMTAIAKGESGLNPLATGDTTITNTTWGPSVGLFQIRTVKSQTGTGGERDVTALRSSLDKQAKSAKSIKEGQGWGAWTIYNTGVYRKYLADAQKAAQDVGDDVDNPSIDERLKSIGKALLNPGEAVSDMAAGATENIIGRIKPLVMEIVFVGGGLALITMGVLRVGQQKTDALMKEII
jgi:hypothetical protein